MEEIKNLIKNKKFQCSGAWEETKEIFSEIGVGIPKADFFYIDENLEVTEVSAKIFKIIGLAEISVAALKEQIEGLKKEKLKYYPGDIVVSQIGTSKRVLVVVEDREYTIIAYDGNYLNNTTLYKGEWTKRHLRQPTDVELSTIINKFKAIGIDIKLVDGKVDLFWFREVGQRYFYIDLDFKKGVSVKEYKDFYTCSNTVDYLSGNYFKSSEDAKRAFQKLKID